MKQRKYILYIIAILTLIFSGCNTLKQVRAENYLDSDKLQQLIEQKQFTFDAEHVNPMQGPSRPLNSSYTLKLSGDTIEAYLPYFGRAYTAPIRSSEGGIKFKATDYDYKVNRKTDKSFDITIKPNNLDNPDLTGLVIYLNIYEGGSASANINMTNRQPISFSGTISANKKS